MSKNFLVESKMAEKIKLDTKVVIQRTTLSPQDLIRIQKAGEYGPVPFKEQICELEAGGQVLAKGKIVKKRGEYYFKVIENYEELAI